MKAFQKLALVSAIAALPAAGFAMEALDDATMAGVTGQDGISIGLGLDATLNIGIEDLDGFATNHTGAGMLLIEGMSISGTGGPGNQAVVTVEIDSGTNATGDSALQLLIDVGAIEIATGDIFVGEGGDGTVIGGFNALGAVDNTGTPLLSSATIAMAGAQIAIQLGAGAEEFLALTGTITGGLDIANLSVNDVNGGGALTIGQLLVRDASGDLVLDGTTAEITTAGLELTFGGTSGVSGFGSLEIAQMGVTLGSTPSIGNVYITGLDLTTSTITVSGH